METIVLDNTGFRPSVVIMKNEAGSEDWHMYGKRRTSYSGLNGNIRSKTIDPNNTNAQYTISDGVDFYATGFKWWCSASAVNGSGANYVYMAWSDEPLVGSEGNPCLAG